MQEAHYYPFGMQLLGLSTPQIGPEHQFKYNDRELQSEFDLQWYSMDWRQLDPQLGRWTSIDPVTHWRQSPYTAMDDNPVALSDPLGLTAGPTRKPENPSDFDFQRITLTGEALSEFMAMFNGPGGPGGDQSV